MSLFFKGEEITKHCYFLKDDPYGIKYMKQQANKTYFLRKSNSDPLNSISCTYKTACGDIGQLKITNIDNKWMTNWEDSDGEPIEIIKNSILEIIEYIFPDYQPPKILKT